MASAPHKAPVVLNNDMPEDLTPVRIFRSFIYRPNWKKTLEKAIPVSCPAICLLPLKAVC
jgi:hypothetical protein